MNARRIVTAWAAAALALACGGLAPDNRLPSTPESGVAHADGGAPDVTDAASVLSDADDGARAKLDSDAPDGPESARPFAYPLGETSNAREMRATAARLRVLDTALPSLDYRHYKGKNAVTPAKDQKGCAASWAFAAVGVYESKYLLAPGSEFDLSEQQLLSLDTRQSGCAGGSAEALSFWTFQGAGPLDEACTGYSASASSRVPLTSCPPKPTRLMSHRDAGYYTVDATQVAQIKLSLLTDGPAYFRFDVYQDFFEHWHHGAQGAVYTQSMTAAPALGGHAVLLIGWDDSKGAWLAKNSWGKAAGPNHDGTFWMAMSGHAKELDVGVANTRLNAFHHDYEKWWGGSFYGKYGTFLGDVTGDGKADLVGLGEGYIGVLRSEGNTFGAYETWSGKTFNGVYGNFLADVTGDKKADLVQLSDGEIGVLPSTGNDFAPYQTWGTATFKGAYGNFLADVTGDGKADLVALGDGAIAVRPSLGATFGATETWSTETFYGFYGTQLADVTGDGKADLVALDDGRISVLPSLGNGFGASEIWSTESYYGSHGTWLADVTGDGKADLVAVGNGYIGVAPSSGHAFGAHEVWWRGSFFGVHGTLLADVTGDKKADPVRLDEGAVMALAATK